MFSRSTSALPAHAPCAHGASRATDLCVSLAIDSASNFVGAALYVVGNTNVVVLVPKVFGFPFMYFRNTISILTLYFFPSQCAISQMSFRSTSRKPHCGLLVLR